MIPEIKELEKKGAKFALITLAGGKSLGDLHQKVVSRGIITRADNGRQVIAYAEPKKKRIYDLYHALESGRPFLLLRGHTDFPILQGDYRDVSASGFSCRVTVLDAVGGRFIDADGDNGEKLIAHIASRLIAHNLSPETSITLMGKNREAIPGDFKQRLLSAIGAPTVVDARQQKPATPVRHAFLTDKMKEALRQAADDIPPKILFKVFSPEGAATWLLCSMEDDNDTLWAICDIGAGIVEYGTVSLRELEEYRSPMLKLPIERDRHIDCSKLDFIALVRKKTLAGC